MRTLEPEVPDAGRAPSGPATEALADEERLLERCSRGERAAMRALYDRHARIVMARARRLGLPAHEVEDVAQEVFTAAFESVEKIRPGSLAGFLFRLTSNRVHDRFRRRRVRETFARWFGPSETEEELEGPEEQYAKKDAERQVARILERMTQKKREVFALFELEGVPGEEIAAQLEIPIDTVWTRLHHARLEFAKIGRSLKLFEEAGREAGDAR